MILGWPYTGAEISEAAWTADCGWQQRLIDRELL
jgi:hypothetical protein